LLGNYNSRRYYWFFNDGCSNMAM